MVSDKQEIVNELGKFFPSLVVVVGKNADNIDVSKQLPFCESIFKFARI